MNMNMNMNMDMNANVNVNVNVNAPELKPASGSCVVCVDWKYVGVSVKSQFLCVWYAYIHCIFFHLGLPNDAFVFHVALCSVTFHYVTSRLIHGKL